MNRNALLSGWSLINWFALAVALIVVCLLVFLLLRGRTRAEESRQRPEAIAGSSEPQTRTLTVEETTSAIDLPRTAVMKEGFLGIQASEQEAFREFLDERGSKQAQGIETATARVAPTDEQRDSSELHADDDFNTEAAHLLLQERTLRDAVKDLKYLALAKARREFEEKARLRAEGRTHDEHVSSRAGLDSNVVPSLEEENRYRSEAETLRKAAGELARRRQAVDAVRTADCNDVDPAKEQKQTGMPELEVLSKKSAS